MAEDDNVRIYYVRGNHDHEIDEKSVKELFGEKVRIYQFLNNSVV